MSLAEGLYNPPLVSEASQGIGRYFGLSQVTIVLIV